MTARRANLLLLLLLLSSRCLAQEKAGSSLILKMDQNVSGPFLGEKSLSCLRVYADGKILYAVWWNSPSIVDEKTGKELKREHMISKELRLEKYEVWALSEFLHSKAVAGLPEHFGPPHPAIDYFENTVVEVMATNGVSKRISIQEYHVAALWEKAKYPSALIVLMDHISELEEETKDKGKPAQAPPDCRLKP